MKTINRVARILAVAILLLLLAAPSVFAAMTVVHNCDVVDTWSTLYSGGTPCTVDNVTFREGTGSIYYPIEADSTDYDITYTAAAPIDMSGAGVLIDFWIRCSKADTEYTSQPYLDVCDGDGDEAQYNLTWAANTWTHISKVVASPDNTVGVVDYNNIATIGVVWDGATACDAWIDDVQYGTASTPATPPSAADTIVTTVLPSVLGIAVAVGSFLFVTKSAGIMGAALSVIMGIVSYVAVTAMIATI